MSLLRSRDPLDGMSQGEEAVRTAILEKVLNGGRQPPADLMLRCELHNAIYCQPAADPSLGTILDAAGTEKASLCPFVLMRG